MMYNRIAFACLLGLGLFLSSCSRSTGPADVEFDNRPSPYHIVKKGETVSEIARRYSMTKQEIIKLNQLKEPYYIFVGQRLLVKPTTDEPMALEHAPQTTLDGVEVKALSKDPNTASTATPSQEEVSFVPDDVETTSPDESGSGEPDPSTVQETAEDKVNKAKEEPKETVKEQIPPSKGGFMRPVDGKVIKGFSKDNPGLNIQAPLRTPVVAAQAGNVHHAGVLENLGNTVVLKHPNGLLTIYAHLDSLAVKSGEKVSKGQKIGSVGKTGKASKTPTLHFEVRQGKKPVDPEKFLSN
jgi:lipoprotein NlpD